MHFGINNPSFHYKMFERTGKEVLLEEVSSENDLGIIFQSNLKLNEHVNMVANKAKKMKGLILAVPSG